MDNKEIIRRFYEDIVSENLLEELPRYVSEDCTLRAGEKMILQYAEKLIKPV